MLWTTQRKSHRFHIAVSIRIQGVDLGGCAFDCEAWTLDVSGDGACINIPERLLLPRRIHVVADDYQFQANADVDIVWERTYPQRAIGVRLAPGTPAEAWNAR
jgi:PilZ domain-containing protein